MADHKLIIPIEKIKTDFQTFLQPEHNKRIIFSGPFGIGKTYFLNEFFKDRSEYYSIFLRPINYSLLSNDDVFKLIKYDILAQIIQNVNFNIDDEFNFSNAEYLKYFLSENRFLILRNLLKAIPKIRNVVSAAEELEKLFSKYKEGLDTISKNPELEMLKEFQQESENNFLLEYDEVSDYISSKLDEIAEAKNEDEAKLKKVLIIDDLDRLDPEHIFRLFNVFSAHFDQVHYYDNSEGNDNKFGFDKIIFVCDIENIRKIFTHRYGAEVDFSGYIDKFYSTEVYYFFQYAKFNEDIYPYYNKLLNSYFNDSYNSSFFKAFKILLQFLYENREISVRDFEKISKINQNLFNINEIIVPFQNCGANYNSYLNKYGFLIALKLLLNIFMHKELLIRKFHRALTSNIFDLHTGFYQGELNSIITQIFLFSEINTHKFQEKIEFNYELKNNEIITYKIETGRESPIISAGNTNYWISKEILYKKIDNEFADLLSKAIVNVFEYGLLK